VVTTRAARIWIEDDEILRCDCLPDVAQTLADAEETMAVFWEVAGRRRVPVMIDLRRARSIDRAARTHYGGPEGARVQLAAGLLIGSPVSRMLGNIFLGFNNLRIPVRLFTAEDEALGWLRGWRAVTPTAARGAASDRPA
jgi:hypothetical protein